MSESQTNFQTLSVSKADLEAAAKHGAMAPADVDSLWNELTAQARARGGVVVDKGGFDLAQLAWYAGGVLVMIAMAWFMERANNFFGAGGVFGLSLAYAAAFAYLGNRLRFQLGQKTAGGVLFLLSVLMTPVALLSGLEMLQFTERLSSSQVALLAELATLGAGLLVLNRVKVSLLAAPVFGSMWLLSMTIADLVASPYFGPLFGFASHAYLKVSMVIGLAILALSVYVDTRVGRQEDYSWWGYLFGTAAFWLPLTFLDSGGEAGKFFYFALNVLFMLLSVARARKVFLLVGAIGSIYYVVHLLMTYFTNSLAFPLALMAFAGAIFYLGLLYRRHKLVLEARLLALVPTTLRRRLPRG